MIRIQSYLKKNDIQPQAYNDAIYNNSQKLNDFFINIANKNAKTYLNKGVSHNKGRELPGVVYIEINYNIMSSFIDCDDLDWMWHSLLTMVYNYMNDGSYGETDEFTNILKWSIKNISSSPRLILFETNRGYPISDGALHKPFERRLKSSCQESAFLQAVVTSGEEYLLFRMQDTRLNTFVTESQALLEKIKSEMLA